MLLIHDPNLALCVPQNRRMPMAGLKNKVFKSFWEEGLKAVGNPMPIEW